jgi:hypothetical protein
MLLDYHPFDSPKTLINLTDIGFIIAGMAKENPRHNVLSWSGFIAAFYRVLVCWAHRITHLQARRRTELSKAFRLFPLKNRSLWDQETQSVKIESLTLKWSRQEIRIRTLC